MGGSVRWGHSRIPSGLSRALRRYVKFVKLYSEEEEKVEDPKVRALSDRAKWERQG